MRNWGKQKKPNTFKIYQLQLMIFFKCSAWLFLFLDTFPYPYQWHEKIVICYIDIVHLALSSNKCTESYTLHTSGLSMNFKMYWSLFIGRCIVPKKKRMLTETPTNAVWNNFPKYGISLERFTSDHLKVNHGDCWMHTVC